MAATPTNPALQAPASLLAGNQNALNTLNSALNSNSQAYGGLQNQAQQQYQQNAGNVQENLVNSGLGNTTVAQTLQQAPLQTLNNALLNITGQQQGQAANIYGQQAGIQSQTGNNLSQLLMALQGQNMQGQLQGSEIGLNRANAETPFQRNQVSQVW
jgi:hypothetical protein